MKTRVRVSLSLREFDALVGWLSDADRPDVNLLAQSINDSDVAESQLRDFALTWIDAVLFNAHSGEFEPHIAGFRDASFEDQLRRFRQLNALLHPDRHPEGSDWATSRSQAVNAVYRRFKRDGPGSQIIAYGPTPSGPSGPSRPKARSSSDPVGPSGNTPPAEWLTQLRWWLAGHQHLPERIVAGFALTGLVILALVLVMEPGDPIAPELSVVPVDTTSVDPPVLVSDFPPAAQSHDSSEQQQPSQGQGISPTAVAVIKPLESVPSATAAIESSGRFDTPVAELLAGSSLESSEPLARDVPLQRDRARGETVTSSGPLHEIDGQSEIVSTATENALAEGVAQDDSPTNEALRPSALWPDRTVLAALSSALSEIGAGGLEAHQQTRIARLLADVQRSEDEQHQLRERVELDALLAAESQPTQLASSDPLEQIEPLGANVMLAEIEALAGLDGEVAALYSAASESVGDTSAVSGESATVVQTRVGNASVESSVRPVNPASLSRASQPDAESAMATQGDSRRSGTEVIDAGTARATAASASSVSVRLPPAVDDFAAISTSLQTAGSASVVVEPEPIAEAAMPAAGGPRLDENSASVRSIAQGSTSSPNELLDAFTASFASGDRERLFSLVTPTLRADPAPMLAWLGQSADSLFAPGLSRKLDLKPTGLHRASNALRYLVQYQLTYEQSGSRVRREGSIYVTVESVGKEDWRIASFAMP